jgi:hypothetical protein
MGSLERLPAIVLGPLRERSAEEWQRGPAGKWTAAQIVEHLALGLELSAKTFQTRRDRAPMVRPRTPAEKIAKLLILGFGWFPPGRKAPSLTVPASEITRETAEAHFLAGVATWRELERELLPARRHNLFAKHPRLGDLTLEEWIRFHRIHARHHARQIRRLFDG